MSLGTDRRSAWAVALIACSLSMGASRASAQKVALGDRLDSATAASVQHIADSLHSIGLPSDPIIAKALEGASRHATPDRIVLVVRALAAALGTARTSLGPAATAPELEAGASALLSGAQPIDLHSVHDARTGMASTLPLVILGDLLTRGVPADVAADAVVTVSRRRDDAALVEFQYGVARDIAAGARPADVARLRAHVRGGDSTQAPRRVPPI